MTRSNDTHPRTAEAVAPEEDEATAKARERWHAAAVCLGFNECAKLAKTLGEKTYFRIMRQGAEEHFMSLGGARVFQQEPAVLTLTLDDGMPFVEFREQDIELMRATVAAHDAEKGASK